jgi:holo-[acyl-carrier protein] synthase
MIIGIGNDIIEIDRIKKSIERSGQLFINKIFTPDEIDYCESKGASKWESYAARFAAKEAVAKAMPSEIDKKISWKDVEVKKHTTGKIEIILSKHAQSLIQPTWKLFVTLSHNKTMSMATVILEESSRNSA